MLIFKVAKFVLKHPLLTHGARQNLRCIIRY